MTSKPETRKQMEGLLEGYSDSELHELCIDALRREYRAGRLNTGQVQVHGHLGRALIERIAEARGLAFTGPPWEVNVLSETFLDALGEPSMRGVLEFIAWFTRVGLAWPLGALPNQTPITLLLTRAGHRFLEVEGDHPLLPEALERLVARCPGLPESAASLLGQSWACLEHGLAQPAVSLMGVAFECVVDEVIELLVNRQVLEEAARERRAAQRIQLLRERLDVLLPGKRPEEKDDREAARLALDFADHVRRRRNDASHTTPRHSFEDQQEVEEFLVSAGRHLPNLWKLTAG